MIRSFKVLSLFFVFNLLGSTLCAQRIFILIHGTWGQKSDWHMPGGEFFDSLQKSIDPINDKVISFLWSGGLGHSARSHAAQALVLLIKSYPPDTEFIVVGHSHGANVGLFAAHIIGSSQNPQHRIKHFITLGVPVDHSRYDPDMHIIGYLYNLFSFDDLLQTVFGTARRSSR